MQGRIGLIENLKKQATGDPNELSKISTFGLKKMTGTLRGWKPYWTRHFLQMFRKSQCDQIINLTLKAKEVMPARES